MCGDGGSAPTPAARRWSDLGIQLILANILRMPPASLLSGTGSILSVRFITLGDFTRWKEHDAYTAALDRLLRDLRVEKG
jgi:hypothetical protein